MGYKTTCPNPACHGHNFYITEHNKFGYCFNCGYYEKGDSAYTNTPKEMSPNVDKIRALYTQAAKYYHSSLDGEAYTYLYNRGFTDDTIQELLIGYCPSGHSPLYNDPITKDAGLAHHDKTAFLADRITFPYFNEDGVVTDIRGRSMNPLEETKYKSLLGSSYYRGAIYPYNYQFHTQNKILITEGEIKADIAYQYGYPTLALPGMTAWRQGLEVLNTNTSQERILIFDNQKYRYIQVCAAIIKAAKRIKNIKIATLPLMGKNKQDIDGFILAYGKKAFETIVQGALPFNQWYALQRF